MRKIARYPSGSALTPSCPSSDPCSIYWCHLSYSAAMFVPSAVVYNLFCFLFQMSSHKCTCPTCSQHLQELEKKYNKLLVDYRCLALKHQTALNTQSAYQYRTQQMARESTRKAIRIKQLECQLETISVSVGKQAGSPEASMFESERFRRDVSRNQELNHLIDSKNKDILALKEQLRPVEDVLDENRQLKERNAQMVGSIEEIQRRMVLIERERATYYNRYISLEQENGMLKNRAVENVPTFSKDSHPKTYNYYQPPNKNPEGLRMTASLLDQVKGGSLYGSTQEGSPKNSINPIAQAALNQSYDSYLHESKRPKSNMRVAGNPQEGSRNSQLYLIQSKIEQLQKENSYLREELNGQIY